MRYFTHSYLVRKLKYREKKKLFFAENWEDTTPAVIRLVEKLNSLRRKRRIRTVSFICPILQNINEKRSLLFRKSDGFEFFFIQNRITAFIVHSNDIEKLKSTLHSASCLCFTYLCFVFNSRIRRLDKVNVCTRETVFLKHFCWLFHDYTAINILLVRATKDCPRICIWIFSGR